MKSANLTNFQLDITKILTPLPTSQLLYGLWIKLPLHRSLTCIYLLKINYIYYLYNHMTMKFIVVLSKLKHNNHN